MTHQYKSGPVPANRIEELRVRSRLTQKELGVLLGKDDTTIAAYEARHRRLTPAVVKALAKVFKVETYEIYVNPQEALEE